MTDGEIIKYFTVKNNVCGRFSEPQLDRINRQLGRPEVKASNSWTRWVTAAALFASTAFYRVAAQTTSVTPTVQQSLTNSHPADLNSSGATAVKGHGKVIKGRVVDEAGMPLAGATIQVVGTDAAFPTDTGGRFNLHLPKEAKQLMISFVGFETETVCIDSFNDGYDLKMTSQVVSMDGVVINPHGYTQRRTELTGGAVAVSVRRSWLWRMYYKYIRTPIHNIFY